MSVIRSEYAANRGLSVRPGPDPLIAYAATQRARAALKRHRRERIKRACMAALSVAAVIATAATTGAAAGL